MMFDFIQKLDEKLHFEPVRAHCDIPCGIYDPISAQIAALSVVRMMDLMVDLGAGGGKDMTGTNNMSRYITVKEEHAEETKHEIRVIWGDFIKPDHVEKYPQLHTIVHEIMMLGSKCRQTADRANGVALVEKVNDFAEIFWAIKGIQTKRAKAPYAPALEMVYPDL